MTKLTVSTKIYAPLDKVRECRTNPVHIPQRNFASDDWYCPEATNDLRVGGHFLFTMSARDGSFSFVFSGQYDVVDPLKRIEYTMGEFEQQFVPAGRKCTVLFEEDGSCGCVTVTETFDAEDIHDLDMQRAGWQAILENFKNHVARCV
jgi:uncharacterized protein YndB with AHSA1/START domain